MFKPICLKIIITTLLSVLLLGQVDTPALAAEVKFSKGSTLESILQRGELRIGLEVGYMPFEMIDKRSGLR
jgi:polar amino acid transport system substrate-binding protein